MTLHGVKGPFRRVPACSSCGQQAHLSDEPVESLSFRYTIHKIGNEQCTEIGDETLAAASSLQEASTLAAHHSNWIYGSAIKDNATGEVDYGFGFGVPVPDPEEDGTRN